MLWTFDVTVREQGLKVERVFGLCEPSFLIIHGVGDVVTEQPAHAPGASRMKQTQIDRLVELDVTLDGKPARISGRLLDFAIVAEPGTGPSVEFAWPTVQHIVDRGGGFKSH